MLVCFFVLWRIAHFNRIRPISRSSRRFEGGPSGGLDWIVRGHSCGCEKVLRSVDSPGTVITAVVLSHGGRMLFVGTSSGAVRSLRFPLATPSEWSEFRAHGSSISKVQW